MVSIELYKPYIEIDNYSLREDVSGTLSDNFTLEIDTENIITITKKDYNGNICKDKAVNVKCNKGGFRRTIKDGVEEDVPTPSNMKKSIFEYYNRNDGKIPQNWDADDWFSYNQMREWIYYYAHFYPHNEWEAINLVEDYNNNLPPIQEVSSNTDNQGQLKVVYYADEWGFCTITVNEVAFQVYVTGWRTEYGWWDGDSPRGISAEIGEVILRDLRYFVDESIRHIIIYGVYDWMGNGQVQNEINYDEGIIYGNLIGKRLRTTFFNEYSVEESFYPYRPLVAKRTLTYTPDIVWYCNSNGEIKCRAKGYDVLPIPQSVRISYDLTHPMLDGREV